MTPKLKANELFNKFNNIKFMAINCVDEIIGVKLLWYQKDTKELDYWKKVKEEINKL